MAENEEQKRKVFKLTSNIVQKKKLFDKIPYVNIIEGIIFTTIVLLIINALPFVSKFKIVSSLVYSLVIMIFCCKGIYSRCVTEVIIDYIRFRKKRKVLHLGDANDERKNATRKSSNESYAERGFNYIKGKYADIKKQIESR